MPRWVRVGAIGVGDACYLTMDDAGYDVSHNDLDLVLNVGAGAIDDAPVTAPAGRFAA